MDQNIQAYIKQARLAGQTDAQIMQALLAAGWKQDQINEAFGIPTPPTSQAGPQLPPLPRIQAPNDLTQLDEKTKATIKASTIWNAVATLIRSVISMVATYFLTVNLFGSFMGSYVPARLINVGALVSGVVFGAIGGAIAGWVLAKFYPVLMVWQQRFTGGKLNTLFKLLFWPYLIGIAFELLVGGAAGVIYSGFGISVIIALADLAAIYLYAKMMDKTVGKYYNK